MKEKTLIIGMMADYAVSDEREWIRLPRHYLTPITQLCGVLPLLIPPMENPDKRLLTGLLDKLDGLILTGSPSNIAPSHYAEDWQTPDLPQDHLRDATSLPLVEIAIAKKIPLLGICRGFQEINVALGGSLHQKVHHCTGYIDHRPPPEKKLSEQMELLAHRVTAQPGGLLASIVGHDSFWVNSLHSQGIKTLAPSLKVEAYAEDGLIEAHSLKLSETDENTFVLALQWHPEWKATENPQSVAIFKAFAKACQAYQRRVHSYL